MGELGSSNLPTPLPFSVPKASGSWALVFLRGRLPHPPVLALGFGFVPRASAKLGTVVNVSLISEFQHLFRTISGCAGDHSLRYWEKMRCQE